MFQRIFYSNRKLISDSGENSRGSPPLKIWERKNSNVKNFNFHFNELKCSFFHRKRNSKKINFALCKLTFSSSFLSNDVHFISFFFLHSLCKKTCIYNAMKRCFVIVDDEKSTLTQSQNGCFVNDMKFFDTILTRFTFVNAVFVSINVVRIYIEWHKV